MKTALLSAFLLAIGTQAGGLSRTYQIIEMLESSGNVEQAINLTTYCAVGAPDDEVHYYKALLSHLKAGTWKDILPNAQNQVEEFGFSFALDPQRALIADFTVEILSGISAENLEARTEAADELNVLFPNTKVFRYLVQEFTKIRRSLTERQALEAEVEAKSIEVGKMRARLKDSSGRADWQQDDFIKMTIAQEELNTMRKNVDSLEHIKRKLDLLVTNVRKHLAKAGASGEY
jgi:hypothetical protein